MAHAFTQEKDGLKQVTSQLSPQKVTVLWVRDWLTVQWKSGRI